MRRAQPDEISFPMTQTYLCWVHGEDIEDENKGDQTPRRDEIAGGLDGDLHNDVNNGEYGQTDGKTKMDTENKNKYEGYL